MRAFLNELTDPQLLLPISYESALTKNRYAIPLWQMMSPPSGPAACHTVRRRLTASWPDGNVQAA